jgi:hypothetical protein
MIITGHAPLMGFNHIDRENVTHYGIPDATLQTAGHKSLSN